MALTATRSNSDNERDGGNVIRLRLRIPDTSDRCCRGVCEYDLHKMVAMGIGTEISKAAAQSSLTPTTGIGIHHRQSGIDTPTIIKEGSGVVNLRILGTTLPHPKGEGEKWERPTWLIMETLEKGRKKNIGRSKSVIARPIFSTVARDIESGKIPVLSSFETAYIAALRRRLL